MNPSAANLPSPSVNLSVDLWLKFIAAAAAATVTQQWVDGLMMLNFFLHSCLLGKYCSFTHHTQSWCVHFNFGWVTTLELLGVCVAWLSCTADTSPCGSGCGYTFTDASKWICSLSPAHLFLSRTGQRVQTKDALYLQWRCVCEFVCVLCASQQHPAHVLVAMQKKKKKNCNKLSLFDLEIPPVYFSPTWKLEDQWKKNPQPAGVNAK